jgi:glycerophosphoryl diester phosphodiesterase
VLDWARGRVAVNVEAKHDVPDRVVFARAIARALSRHPDVEVLLSSFDPVLLALLAALSPHVPRAWLTHEGQRRWEPLWARLAIHAPITAVHLERTLADPATVGTLQRAGKSVGVWTVNDPGEARDLEALGVDWLITDAPGALRG